MTTESKLNANRQNATHSTGPRTEAGKAASSRNAVTMGLYTRSDYVKPEERDLYKEFCETMYDQLNPASLLEESFVSEITGATWRLRRCSAAEAELGDFDAATDKTRRSIERARAGANSLLHRGINQLRKLQTERATREQIQAGTSSRIAQSQPGLQRASSNRKPHRENRDRRRRRLPRCGPRLHHELP
jgi:hypothetical protein